eukprot:1158080-Pelagomonas_calceolata.AAC.4
MFVRPYKHPSIPKTWAANTSLGDVCKGLQQHPRDKGSKGVTGKRLSGQGAEAGPPDLQISPGAWSFMEQGTSDQEPCVEI